MFKPYIYIIPKL